MRPLRAAPASRATLPDQIRPRFGQDFGPESAVQFADEDLACERVGESFGCDDVVRFAVGDDLAVAQEDDLRCPGRQFLDVVCDEQDGGGVGLFEEQVECGEDLFATSDVEACGRFVEDEQFRRVRQCSREHTTSLFTCGHEFEAQVTAHRQADMTEQLVSAFVLFGHRPVVQGNGTEEAGENGFMRGQLGVDDGAAAMRLARVDGGVDDGDAPAQRTDVRLADGFTEHAHTTLRDEHVPGDASGQRGFPPAVWAKDRGARAAGDRARYAAKDVRAATDDVHVVYVDGDVIVALCCCCLHFDNIIMVTARALVLTGFIRTRGHPRGSFAAVGLENQIMQKRYHNWLIELTGIPTAAGCERRVIDWVMRWVERHNRTGRYGHCSMTSDRFGNLLITRRGARSSRPIILTAHLDHPAFVVTKVIDARSVQAEFRGGMRDEYFVGSKVTLHPGGKDSGGGERRGVITQLEAPTKTRLDKRVTIELTKPIAASHLKTTIGAIATWSVGNPRIRGDRLHAPACDDLAGVAAALSAFDAIHRLCRGSRGTNTDVAVLLTRCEELGFVGAIGACKSGLIARRARVINLENSRSFADSPVGDGPIVRVGDAISTWDPDLSYRIAHIAAELAHRDKSFTYQRKLMPGGMCEASCFATYGLTATCLCLPVGNCHNMNDRTGKVAAEFISVRDFDHLVHLLVTVSTQLDDRGKSPALKRRLDELFVRRRSLLA